MSLASWTIFYISSLLLGSLFLGSDRELRKEMRRSVIRLIVFLMFTLLFVVGLLFPDLRLFIIAQPN